MSTHLHEQSQQSNGMVNRILGRYKVFGAKGHIPGGSKSEKFVDSKAGLFVRLIWVRSRR